jgi:CubicO group peptidase (beta-lactamase class C family)
MSQAYIISLIRCMHATKLDSVAPVERKTALLTLTSALVLVAAAPFVLAAPADAGPAAPTHAGHRTMSCYEPGRTWERRSPRALGIDDAKLQQVLDWASLHSSATVSVFRHGCLAGQSRVDPVTSQVAIDGWSMTKSVTAMLVGRAVTLGLLDIDKPIGALYPEADAKHAALTPRHLLTMSSGLHANWGRDLMPQPDRVRDALALPFDYKPGTHWQYHQSPVTLLANVVERAVGQDVQDFAQDELFGPLGIRRSAWDWERDRAGHTEGWAHLHMNSRDWARLGQLMLQGGRWRGRQVIAKDYVRKAVSPSRVNGAYGFLFFLNAGGKYVLPDTEGEDKGRGPIVPAAPHDMYLMAGNQEQRVYVIPSRDLVIVRLGNAGSREPDTRASLWTSRSGQLDHEIMRGALRAVTDVPYDDPGEYPGSDLVLPPLDEGIVGDARDTEQTGAGLGAGPSAPPGCSPVGCD